MALEGLVVEESAWTFAEVEGLASWPVWVDALGTQLVVGLNFSQEGFLEVNGLVDWLGWAVLAAPLLVVGGWPHCENE